MSTITIALAEWQQLQRELAELRARPSAAMQCTRCGSPATHRKDEGGGMRSATVKSVQEGLVFAHKVRFPIEILPSFTLNGNGRGTARTTEQFIVILQAGLDLSPVTECEIREIERKDRDA